MARGEVWAIDIDLPDRSDPTKTVRRRKYAVELQGPAFAHNDDVAIVLASSDRQPTKPARSFEVKVGPAEGFQHETLIDGRWVWTVPRARLAGTPHITTLSAQVMQKVSEAIVVGLDLF